MFTYKQRGTHLLLTNIAVPLLTQKHRSYSFVTHLHIKDMIMGINDYSRNIKDVKAQPMFDMKSFNGNLF